jgi:hypothetical protein
VFVNRRKGFKTKYRYFHFFYFSLLNHFLIHSNTTYTIFSVDTINITKLMVILEGYSTAIFRLHITVVEWGHSLSQGCEFVKYETNCCTEEGLQRLLIFALPPQIATTARKPNLIFVNLPQFIVSTQYGFTTTLPIMCG